MAPVLRVDDEVWEWLKTKATPFEDTPNSVLRRIAGIDQDPVGITSPTARSKRGLLEGARSDSRLKLFGPFLEKLRRFVAQRRGSVAVWQGSAQRKTSHIVEVTPTPRQTSSLLYIKTRSESEGFWGLRKNQLDGLRDSGKKWSLVLLIGPGEKGYVLSSDDVQRAIKDHHWSFGQVGDFKVHENYHHEMGGSAEFNTWSALIAHVFE